MWHDMMFTLLTVAVSSLQLTVPFAIALALLIAAVKGSMVAGVFMHLTSEKKIIYGTIVLTFVLLIGLLVLPTWGHFDRPKF